MLSAPIKEPTLSLADAAAELGIKISTLRDRMWKRQIGYFAGRPVRIPLSEIHRLKREAWKPAMKLERL